MTVENTATITCNTAQGFDPVSALDTASIEVRSVDGDVDKNCIPPTQQAPGTINWDWTVTNTSPDGKSELDVSCDGFSTINDQEVEDDLLTVLTFGGTATNMWTESGLESATYENEITCTFTAQDDRTFERMASDSCDVLEFDVSIDKDCDEKVVQVPGNPADPIDCTITVENTGEETLTNCVVSDDLTGVLALPATLTAGQIAAVATQTTVTDAMITAMTVTNTATITCDTAQGFDPVTALDTASIEVRSVDGDVDKNCEPDSQLEPGTINWDWTVTNTSPDEKSALDVSCDGFSTINDPEAQDDLLTVLVFGGTATNMWTESGLGDASYSNEITCTFTAQDDRSFEIMADATCVVEPTGGAGCTPGFWKNNADKKDYAAWPASAIMDFSFSSVFDRVITIDVKGKGNTITDPTLEEALGATGGEINALARHGVAAYLNSIDDEVDYPHSTNEVIEWVQDGVDNPNETDTHKNELAEANEIGCTQNQKGEPIELEPEV